jgi:D-alanyl-D-alanine carboxypeptidase
MTPTRSSRHVKNIGAKLMNRREALSLGLLVSATAALEPAGNALAKDKRLPGAVDRELDRFILGYCKEMSAPALTLGLADRDGLIRTSTYGYADPSAKIPADTSQLFEIGSISKSFIAILVLQLREAGKLDLQSPIRDHLPWLQMETPFGEILVHHLLTHSGGMPSDAPVYPNALGIPARQSCTPGTKFYYSNWGYQALGFLIEKIEGRPWSASLADRILEPLGMSQTVPLITSQTRPRIIKSYVALHDDRPFPRQGALAPAANLVMTDAAGSIASTAGDMALYLQMLMNRGATRTGRLLSEESFQLFTKPHIPASHFGPGASYGYGLVVDSLDGRTRLRHTGGMASFMSSLQVDLESGFGAFASINAQLGYRPDPVTQYALRLMHSQSKGQSLPKAPPFNAAAELTDALSYLGVFTDVRGRRIEIRQSGAAGLEIVANDHKGDLRHVDGDEFIALHPQFDLYPVIFEREAAAHSGPADHSDKPQSIVGLFYGADRYVNKRHGPPTLPPSESLNGYVGTYYTENPWYDTTRVVQRQGQLWFGDGTVLSPIGNHLFRLGADPSSPDLVEFASFVGTVAHVLRVGTAELRRIPEDVA